MPDPDHEPEAAASPADATAASARTTAVPPWPLADDPASLELHAELLAAWGEAGRTYHDLRHLGEVLSSLDALEAAGVAFDATTVRLAAWFHDSVYDGERDAEERSATWAEDVLPALVDQRTVAEVARLVRLTETHRPEDDDPDGCALSDADLAILAAEPARYAEYVAAVRREYAHVGDDDFARGRAGVLEDLLAKPRLFHTEHGARSWEGPARANTGAQRAPRPARPRRQLRAMAGTGRWRPTGRGPAARHRGPVGGRQREGPGPGARGS